MSLAIDVQQREVRPGQARPTVGYLSIADVNPHRKRAKTCGMGHKLDTTWRRVQQLLQFLPKSKAVSTLCN